jgi:DNA-binding winged helix-turn-helix (wHTH) protein/TolB-like protein
VVRVGDFEFEPSTGDLRRVHPEPPGETVRLAPQPAKLLALLIERKGDLLEREEIRRAIWPDTHVDFDQSLAFCVRQLRAALGDSGAKPTYVETLPRRGFRLVAPVTANGNNAPAPGPPPPVAASTPARRLGPLLAGAAVVIAMFTFALRSSRAPASPPRLAIMPFELAATVANAEDRARLARISEWLVAELARDRASPIEVIGPRTTASYHGSPFPDLDALVEDLDADYVLNDRYLEESPETPGNVLLVELIRLDDRAHPWVERFDSDRPWEEVARTIRDGVRAAIVKPR